MATVRGKEMEAENLAHLLDDLIRFGNSRVRFGLDPLVGLLPVIGDAVTTACGAALLMTARQLGVSLFVLLQMAYHLLVNGLVGAIPLFGDVFSFQYKCHAKNVALLIRDVRQSDDPACEIAVRPLGIVDVLVVLALTVPIVLLVGYVSLWFWRRELHFL